MNGYTEYELVNMNEWINELYTEYELVNIDESMDKQSMS